MAQCLFGFALQVIRLKGAVVGGNIDNVLFRELAGCGLHIGIRLASCSPLSRSGFSEFSA